MTLRTARRTAQPPYICAHPWPDDCFVQSGDCGVVFSRGSLDDIDTDPIGVLERAKNVLSGDAATGYATAFFEAFPRSPSTFIRGEGASVFQAEDAAWTKWVRYRSCAHATFKKRGYTNGGGFCVDCGMFSGHAFEPCGKD